MPTSLKLAMTIGPAYILILGYVAFALFRRYRENGYAPILLLACLFTFSVLSFLCWGRKPSRPESRPAAAP